MMEAGMIWNGILTFAFGLLGWVLRSYVEELKRVTILLNRTREEMGSGLAGICRYSHPY